MPYPVGAKPKGLVLPRGSREHPRMITQLLVTLLCGSCVAFVPGRPLSCRRGLSAYGRGAEIWPPSNDEAVRLADSFPNNQLPPHVEAVLNQSNELEDVSSSSPASWRRPLSMILRRAAARARSNSVNDDDRSGTSTKTAVPSIHRTPILLTVCLIPLTKPLDVLLATFITGYVSILYRISRQPRSPDNDTPTLPALPPQGHVPYLLNHPLGFQISFSAWYDRWLRLGVLLGLFAPLTMILQYALLGQQYSAASLVARPLLFLSLQAAMESTLSKVLMAPLPLRILNSVLCNVLRLGYLWHWSTCRTVALGTAGRLLAVLNVMYTAINLFGFLLPVGVMR